MIKLIHKVIETSNGWKYLCNQACNWSVEKSTMCDDFVTCKNCLRQIKKDDVVDMEGEQDG